MLDICLLGTGGMMPLPKRFLSSALMRYNGRMLLLDCGEATQISLKILGWGFKNLDVICFTHFHADHISGLPGMLLTLANSGRTEPLTIIGPVGVERIVNSLRCIAPELSFDISFVEMSNEHPRYAYGDYQISACEVTHTTTCLAYKIDIERKGKFNAQKAEELGIPVRYWKLLQNGQNIEGFTPEMVLGEQRKGFRVSYCTDSRPVDHLIPFIFESDLFICEGMYAEDSELEKALERKHMLFSEAATLAKKANVSKLVLTHYSPSLAYPEDFIDTAKKIFPNTTPGYDRYCTVLKYENEGCE